jgi:putative NADH-flavin reductase
MSLSTKIAIVGFTGKMARLITVSLLRSHSNVQIHGICRSPDKVDARTLSNPNVKVFEAASSDTTALRRALAGTSACICCYLGNNTLMTDGQKTLIDACIAEGVPRYIASDWTFDFRKLEFGDHPAKDPMKHVQVYLDEMEKAEKIKAVHILNGAFMEVVWSPFLGLVNAGEGSFRYFGTGDEQLDMTTMEDTARFTAEVAVDPNAHGFLKCEYI